MAGASRPALHVNREGLVRFRRIIVVVAAVVLASFTGAVGGLHAQGLTGQISGTVTDSTTGVLPGVTVTLRNAGTNATRETATRPDGSFVFPDLLAGTYAVKVSLQGFKTYEQKGIPLGATDHVTLRRITLDVGQLEE